MARRARSRRGDGGPRQEGEVAGLRIQAMRGRCPGHGPAGTRLGSPDPRARAAGTVQPPAQQQLMARISAGRKARQQRAVAVVCGAASALVLLIAGSAWALSSYVNSHIGRVNAGTAGTPSSGPLNVLVAGVDERSGLTRYQQARLHVGSAPSARTPTR